MTIIFKMYTKDGCSYCERAKSLIMALLNDGPELLTVKNPDKNTVEELVKKYDHHTYPFIFFENTFIGGYEDLNANVLHITNVLEEKYGKTFEDF